jgi:hypothetical protein
LAVELASVVLASVELAVVKRSEANIGLTEAKHSTAEMLSDTAKRLVRLELEKL